MKLNGAGIVIPIEGDLDAFKVDMERAKGLAREYGRGISDSLNNVFNDRQAKSYTSSMIYNLDRLRRGSALTGKELDNLSIDLKKVKHVTGLSDKAFQALSRRMLNNKAEKAKENALKALQRQAGLSRMEMARLQLQMRQTSGAIKTMAASTGTVMGKLSSTIFNVRNAILTLGAGYVVQSIWDAGRAAESLDIAYKNIFGSTAAASEEMAWLREVSERLGQKFWDLADAYKGLAAAGKQSTLTNRQVRDVFESVTMASTALGLSADNTRGVMYALQQIMSKGKLSAEELRRQMGDRLYGAFGMAAKAMGVTTAQLDDMLKKGLIPAADFLPRFARILRQEFGQGAIDAADSANAAMNRLATAWRDFQVTIAKSGFMEEAVKLIKELTTALKSEGAKDTAKALGEALAGIARMGKSAIPVLQDFLTYVTDIFDMWISLDKHGLAGVGLIAAILLGSAAGIGPLVAGLVVLNQILKALEGSSEKVPEILERMDAYRDKYPGLIGGDLTKKISDDLRLFDELKKKTDEILSTPTKIVDGAFEVIPELKKIQAEFDTLVMWDPDVAPKKTTEQLIKENKKGIDQLETLWLKYREGDNKSSWKWLLKQIDQDQKALDEQAKNKKKALDARTKAEKKVLAERVKAEKAANKLYAELTGDNSKIRQAEYKERLAQLDDALKNEYLTEEEYNRAKQALYTNFNKQALTGWRKTLQEWADAYKNTGKIMEEGAKRTFNTITNSFSSLVSDALRGEFDSIADFFDELGRKLLETWADILIQMASQWAMSGIGSLLEGLLNIGSGTISTGSSATGGATSLVGGVVSGIGKLLGLTGTGAAATATGIGAGTNLGVMGAIGGAPAVFAPAPVAFGGLAGIGGTVTGAVGAGTGVAGAGSVALGSGAAAGGSAAATGAGAGALAAGGMGLLAGGITAGMGAIFALAVALDDGYMSPETAQERIEADLAYLARLQPLVESGALAWDQYGDSLIDVTDEMFDVYIRAGYTEEQLREMVASVGGTAEALFNTAESVRSLDTDLAGLNSTLTMTLRGGHDAEASFTDYGQAIKQVKEWIDKMAESQGLAAGETDDLKEEIMGLIRGIHTGKSSIEDVSNALREFFNPSLSEAQEITEALNQAQSEAVEHFADCNMGIDEFNYSIDSSNNKLKELSSNLSGLPSSLETHYTIFTHHVDSGGGGQYHSGGLVMHGGGWAAEAIAQKLVTLHGGGLPYLKPNEIMAKLERREYVVQEPSVNPDTLPGLKYINQFGQMPPSGGGGTKEINIHIHNHVSGDVIGEAGALQRVAAAAQAGALQALKEGTEEGEFMVCADGVYQRGWNNA